MTNTAPTLDEIKWRTLIEVIDSFPNIEGGELKERSFMAWVLSEALRYLENCKYENKG